MKILKIELQNINSLRCDQPIVIDFESSFFTDVGLYAITGSTGAGKTTILDAITIALYQQVPRFNRSNSRGTLPDVVSYGSEEAMSRVTFAVKDMRYEAQWDIRLTSKNGKPLGTPIENVRLKNLTTGEILAEKKKDYKNAIEQISQLSYSQFLRSVMLAQGEFAAFLSAPQKEKGKLLEQITGEEIYKKIGEKIGEKKTEAGKILSSIKSRMNTEDLLTEEQLLDLEERKSLHSQQLKEMQSQLRQLETVIQWYEQSNRLEAEESAITQATSSLAVKKLENKDVAEKVAVHEEALPFREQLEQVTQTEKSLKDKRQRFPQLKADVSAVKVQVLQAEEEWQFAKAGLNSARQTEQQWSDQLTEVTRLDTVIAQLSTEVKTLQVKKAGLQSQSEDLSRNLAENNKKKKEATSEKEEVRKYLEEKKLICKVIPKVSDWRVNLSLRSNQKEELSRQQKSLEEQESILKNLNSELKDKRSLTAQRQIKLKDLTDQLALVLQESGNDDLRDLLRDRDKLLEYDQVLKEARQILTQTSVISQRKQQQELERSQYLKTLADYSSSLEVLEKEITISSEALADAEKIYELEKKIKSAEEERKKLVAGEPCHVCGSTDHPFVSEYSALSLSESQLKVQDRRTKLEALKDKQQETQVAKASVDTLVNTLTKQTLLLDEELAMNANAFKALGLEDQLADPVALDGKISEIRSEAEQLSNRIQSLEASQKKQRSLRDQIDKEKESGTVTKDAIAALEAQISTRQEQADNTASKIDQLQQKISANETKLQREMDEFEISLPAVEKSDLFINTIEKKITDYQEKEKRSEELDNLIARIDLNVENIESNLAGRTEELKETENSILKVSESLSVKKAERSAILPEGISVAEKRNSMSKTTSEASDLAEKQDQKLQQLKLNLANLEKELSIMEDDGKKLAGQLKQQTGDLMTELSETRFEDAEMLKRSLLSLTDERNYKSILQVLQKEEVALQTRQLEWQKAKAALTKSKRSEKSEKQAIEEKHQLNDRKDVINKELGEISAKINMNDQIRLRNEKVLSEMEDQQEELSKWTTLLKLIGGSKDAFNTYVQRLTLQNLIYLANTHLAKLNRRYSLEMEADYAAGEELNFRLADHYQADEKRLVDTSSGGEKFLISLALALGLSDLASHNVTVGSLFIDEGFGTLDSRTLETVIASLETLQAQGKMIGIISHVENLKERITTQVQVIKKNNGISEVVIR